MVSPCCIGGLYVEPGVSMAVWEAYKSPGYQLYIGVCITPGVWLYIGGIYDTYLFCSVSGYMQVLGVLLCIRIYKNTELCSSL